MIHWHQHTYPPLLVPASNRGYVTEGWPNRDIRITSTIPNPQSGFRLQFCRIIMTIDVVNTLVTMLLDVHNNKKFCLKKNTAQPGQQDKKQP